MGAIVNDNTGKGVTFVVIFANKLEQVCLTTFSSSVKVNLRSTGPLPLWLDSGFESF